MLVGIQAKDVVAEPSQNIEKESASAAEIEDMLPSHSMQSEVLYTFAIEAEVMIYISIFREPALQFPITRLDIAQSGLIEVGHDRAERQWEKITLGTPPGALVGDRVRQLAELVDSDH